MGEHKIVRENRHFGRYLRRIREDRKLSLDAVEEMTTGYPEPVTKSHLSRIENGRAVPTFPRMFALCQVYGVPISSMAERFESDLRRAASVKIDDLNDDEIFERLTELKNCGRYDSILDITTVMMESIRERDPAFELKFNRKIAQRHIDSLVHLGRFETAKIQCEDLLSLLPSNSIEQLYILLSFITCSYRLGRHTVALMGLDRVDSILESGDWSPQTLGIVETVRGPAFVALGHYDRARESFERAMKIFDGVNDEFGVCLARVNLGATLIRIDKLGAALRHLLTAVKVAADRGYDRLNALALSHLVVVHFRKENYEMAEGVAIRSNVIARRQEYNSVVFRNSFYLWRCATLKSDATAAASYQKTLNLLENRLADGLLELAEYRRLREGGVR